MNKLRSYITVGVGFCFLVVAITGVTFEFFFKTKFLENIHGLVGVGMAAFALFHIVQNGRPLLVHFRNWRVYLLLVPIFAAIGFSQRAISTKQRAGDDLNPGMVLGKLTSARAETVAQVFGKDFTTVAKQLEKDGLHVPDAGATIQQIAESNHTGPRRILGYFLR